MSFIYAINNCQRGNIRITFISLICEVRKNLNRQRTLYIFQMYRRYVGINLSSLDITRHFLDALI